MRNVEKVIGRIGDDPDLQAISAYQNREFLYRFVVKWLTHGRTLRAVLPTGICDARAVHGRA
jgi:hypothetical protein